MLTIIIISLIIVYVIGASAWIYFLLRYYTQRVRNSDPNELSDLGLIKKLSLTINASPRQAIESAMVADGRKLIQSHIDRTLNTFTQTEQLPQYVRQHLIDIFEGNTTLVA